MEDMGIWRGESSCLRLEGDMKHERLWTLKNNLRVLKGQEWKLGEPGSGY